MKIEYFQTIRKRDFEENPKHFLTAGHLVFLRPFTAAGHIATATCLTVNWTLGARVAAMKVDGIYFTAFMGANVTLLFSHDVTAAISVFQNNERRPYYPGILM